MKIISVREKPEYAALAISYFQASWDEVDPIIYEKNINASIKSDLPIPQWFILEIEGKIVGCAGLIDQDFIDITDLTPWLCALHVDKEYRENGYGKLLIDRVQEYCVKIGYDYFYLCTELVGYYENYGFEYIGQGYDPEGYHMRIYKKSV